MSLEHAPGTKPLVYIGLNSPWFFLMVYLPDRDIWEIEYLPNEHLKNGYGVEGNLWLSVELRTLVLSPRHLTFVVIIFLAS